MHAIREGGFTGLMVRHQRVAGHISVDYHRAGSAAARLCSGDIPDDVLAGAAILHVTGITPALSESARQAVFDAADRARGLGLTICLDVNYRAKLWEPAAAGPVLRALAARADILLAGPGEARLLLVDEQAGVGPAMLTHLAALGPHEVIVKDGARGCAALIEGASFTLPALSVPVVDPVGAGDAFAAGYLLAGRGVRRRAAAHRGHGRCLRRRRPRRLRGTAPPPRPRRFGHAPGGRRPLTACRVRHPPGRTLGTLDDALRADAGRQVLVRDLDSRLAGGRRLRHRRPRSDARRSCRDRALLATLLSVVPKARAPRRTAPTWSQFLRSQAEAATGVSANMTAAARC